MSLEHISSLFVAINIFQLSVTLFLEKLHICSNFDCICSFVWVAAGKQPDLEKRVGVGGYGYPAMVALNAKKGAYAPLKSGFEVKHLK